MNLYLNNLSPPPPMQKRSVIYPLVNQAWKLVDQVEHVGEELQLLQQVLIQNGWKEVVQQVLRKTKFKHQKKEKVEEEEIKGVAVLPHCSSV